MTAQAAMLDQAAYARQVEQTRQLLDTIDDTSLVSLTRLGVDQVRALKQEVAEIFPASNLPAFLLQGLIQLEDRTLKRERVAADLKVLFRGSTQIGLYGTFLAVPAMVLYGYQRLLSLAGKDVESAFPDGPWQFYTQFGLREDAARHCVETIGFQQAHPSASEVDAATSWVYAALQTLFLYEDILGCSWQENVLPRALDQILAEYVIEQAGRSLPRKNTEREQAITELVGALRREYQLDDFATRWLPLRPYAVPSGGLPADYPVYRRDAYQRYLTRMLRRLPPELHTHLDLHFTTRRATELPAYRRQLALTTTLRAETYEEQRAELPFEWLRVALVAGGRYYLIDACDRDPNGRLLVFPADGGPNSQGLPLDVVNHAGGLRDRQGRPIEIDRRGRVRVAGAHIGRLRPPSLAAIKGEVEAILRQAGTRRSSGETPTSQESPIDLLLAQAPRPRQDELRALLGAPVRAELEALRFAPIIVNWDMCQGEQPLAALRHTRRGCGDHALTLIRTNRSIVFDQSHIFFDGSWGAEVAEILTGFATALYPHTIQTRPQRATAPDPLALAARPAFITAAQAALADVPAEATAETNDISLSAIAQMRRRLAKVDLQFTVNDLLILARCAHAGSYRPGKYGAPALNQLEHHRGGLELAQEIRRQFEHDRAINPALLIPMDAGGVDPRLRVYPATFRNPLPDLLPRLERCVALVRELRRSPDTATRREFDRERQALYHELRAFAALLRALKRVTMRGESFTTTALLLLGHLPKSLQSLVNLIPQKIDILNEIIKGREVFSNVGQVASTSSLTRFASARDDGATKQLVWGIMTDAGGTIRVVLRDFRPHVAPLKQLGRQDLANALAQDYLESYAASVTDLVRSILFVLSYE